MTIKLSSLAGGGGGYPTLGDVIETAATTLAGGQALLPFDGSTYANSAYPDLAALLALPPYELWGQMSTANADTGSVSVSGNNMVANVLGFPAYYSNDKGDTWSVAGGGTTLTTVLTKKTACSGNNMVVLGNNGSPPYMNWSRDAGATWSTRTQGSLGNWRDVALDGNNGVAVGYDSTGDYHKYTTDGFDTILTSTHTTSFADQIYQCAMNGLNVIGVYESTNNGAVYSTDGGATYSAATTPSLSAVNPSAASINASGKAVFTNTAGQVCLSTDSGQTYSLITTPLDGTVKGVHVWANGDIWATTATSLYKTSDDFATWTVEDVVSDVANLTTIYDLKIDETSGVAVVGGVAGTARALASSTTFTLPSRPGNGNIRDRIVAEN